MPYKFIVDDSSSDTESEYTDSENSDYDEIIDDNDSECSDVINDDSDDEDNDDTDSNDHYQPKIRLISSVPSNTTNNKNNFIRKANETVKIYDVEKIMDLEIDFIWLRDNLEHGDYVENRNERTGESYVVYKVDNQFRLIKLNKNDVGGSGYGGIPLCITDYIEDPFQFYKKIHDYYMSFQFSINILKKYNLEDKSSNGWINFS